MSRFFRAQSLRRLIPSRRTPRSQRPTRLGLERLEDRCLLDGTPTVQFQRDQFAVFEDEGTAYVGVTLSFAVNYNVYANCQTQDNTAVSGGPAPDYSANLVTVNFPPNTVGPFFVPISIVNDAIPEGTEDFRVSLTALQGATLGSPGTATVTIVDDDTPVTVHFSQTLYSVEETAGFVPLTVQLNRPSRQPVQVQYRTQDGTATAAEDYVTPPNPSGVTFAPWETVKTFTVGIKNDPVYEQVNERFRVNLLNPTNAALDTPSSAEVEIHSDDALPTLQFNRSNYALLESGGTAWIQMDLTHPSAQPVGVHVYTTAGTATAGDSHDYRDTDAASVFSPGETRQWFPVVVNNDNVDELNETVNLFLDQPSGAVLYGGSQQATLTILDDDAAPIGFVFPPGLDHYEVAEDNGSPTPPTSANVTVRILAPTERMIRVDYTTLDGTAVGNRDYTPVSGHFIFPAGSPPDQSFSVPIAYDAIDENDENVRLRQTGDDPGMGNPEASLVILDNDAPPTVSLTPSTLTVPEGGGPARFTAALSGNASEKTINVGYQVSPGTA